LPSQSHQGTPSPGESNDARSSADSEFESETPRRRDGPSEYQLQREANIAENQKLLARLGLSGGGSSAILGNLPTQTKKGEKGKGKGKGKGYALFFFCIAYRTMV
jgi:hypothetical protein